MKSDQGVRVGAAVTGTRISGKKLTAKCAKAIAKGKDGAHSCTSLHCTAPMHERLLNKAIEEENRND